MNEIQIFVKGVQGTEFTKPTTPQAQKNKPSKKLISEGFVFSIVLLGVSYYKITSNLIDPSNQ